MTKRRLAAIMFTDIQGYTALMQKSESIALNLRTFHREIFVRETERFHGEIVQYYGDGTLSIFESAVDAVQCAIAMQQTFCADERLPVRIGIHSGDILITKEDIVGDSVNIASRLENLGVAGSIMVSEKVNDEIKNHDGIQGVALGSFRLKNVSKPVRVFAIANEGLVVPNRQDIAGKITEGKLERWKIPIGISFLGVIIVALWILQGGVQLGADKPVYQAIAVLPFDNFTGSPDLDYFVEGMHASLIGDLGKVDALRVISPTTARTYKNSGKSVKEIARELNVDVILEASVFCLGDSVCIQPKLIAARDDEKQLWVQDYYQDKKQILNLYTALTKEISSQVNVTLTPDEEQLLAKSQEIDPEAYDLYLKGQYQLSLTTPESLFKARQYFQQASEKEPEWGAPYGGLSSVLGYLKQFGMLKPSEAIPEIKQLLARAVELDPNAAETHYQLAIHEVWSNFDWEKGESEFRKCLALNANHAMAQMFYAHLLSILRRTEEALMHAEKAVDVDPNDPLVHGLYAVVLSEAKQCEKSLQHVQKAQKIEPGHPFSLAQFSRAYECMGEYDQAFEAWKTSHHKLWDRYGVTGRYEQGYREGGWTGALEEAIRINEEFFIHDGRMAYSAQGVRYAKTGNVEKAIETWEQALEMNDPNLPYVSCHSVYDILKDDIRYINFLRKMKLPA